jgi:hypothetical protein
VASSVVAADSTDSTSYSRIKQNWTDVRIPIKLAESIDEFLKTDSAKKQGIFSRSNFLVRMAISWFAVYDRDYNLFTKAPPSPLSPPTTWEEGKKMFEQRTSEQLEIIKQEVLKKKQEK